MPLPGSKQLTLADAGVPKKDLVDLEAWKGQVKEIAKELKRAMRAGNEQEEKMLWRLGDWMLLADDYLKGHVKFQFKPFLTYQTNLSWGRLKNIKVVCKAFPETQRRKGLSFSIHEAVRGRAELLDWVEAEQKRRAEEAKTSNNPLYVKKHLGPVSVRDVEQHIKDEWANANGEAADTKQKAGAKPVIVKIALGMQDYKFLEAVTDEFKCRSRVDSLMYDIVANYFKQNKDEIKARREAYRVAWEEWRKAFVPTATTPPRTPDKPYLPGMEPAPPAAQTQKPEVSPNSQSSETR